MTIVHQLNFKVKGAIRIFLPRMWFT